jgi:hypothetical protein
VFSFSSWLRQLRHNFTSATQRTRKPRRACRIPDFEWLEAREVPAGIWTQLTNTAPNSIGTMALLTDGRVIMQQAGVVSTMYTLTPDINGNYVNGTWQTIAPMNNPRLYYGSAILNDGRYFVVGGEYPGFIPTGEIFDPVAGTWTNITSFPTGAFGDDPVELLDNGTLLAGYYGGPQTYIYNPTTDSWTTTGTKLYGDQTDEEAWVKLPDGSILSYAIFASISSEQGGGQGLAQRYIPSTGTWVGTGSVPVPLSSTALGYELGPAFLLPNGKVFQLGANSNTALYDPSTDSWAAGPVVPNGDGADDAPGAMMPNGHIFFVADHGPTVGTFSPPAHIYDYDPTANKITQVATPAALTGLLNSDPSYTSRLVVLPNGHLLYTEGSSNEIWDYDPNGPAPLPAWQPTITTLAGVASPYTLIGTQLNGISEGGAYGDDVEMATNYPVIELTSTSTGQVYFAPTFGWNKAGVAATSATTTQFNIPAGIPDGGYNLTVIANGISSDPYFVVIVNGIIDLSPVVTTSGNTVFYQAGQAPVVADPNVTVTDLANPKLAFATVQITSGYHIGQDLLSLPKPIGAISGSWNAGTGTLTLRSSLGTDLPANFQAALETVTYVNTQAAPLVTGGTRNLTFLASDGNLTDSDNTDNIIVSPIAISPNNSSLSAQVGVAYSQTFTAIGGTTPYQFSLLGNLPSGVALAGNVLSGIPADGGVFPFTLQVTDAGGFTSTKNYTLTVSPPIIVISPASLPSGTVATSYSQTLSASGGTAPYVNYVIAGGSLPAGLSLTTGGVLGGTPTASGTFNFSVRVTDSSGGTGPFSATKNYRLIINPPTIVISPSTLPNGQIGVNYLQNFSAAGGVAPYHNYSVSTGSLPAGLSLAASGILTGTPTAGGTFNFTVQVLDSSTGGGPYAGTQAYTLVVDPPALTVNPGNLPNGQVGLNFNQTVSMTGGTAPYAFSLVGGALPTGMSLTSTGLLSGTPTGGGVFYFTVEGQDSSTGGGPYLKDWDYILTINSPTITLSPATLPLGQVGVNYNQQLIAAGGTAPYTNFALATGSLPPGMSITSGGTINGVPTATGNFTFAVAVTDSSTGTGPYTETQDFLLTVRTPTITFNPSTLPNAQVGAAYNQPLTPTGGTAPYRNFVIISGALPAGLSISSSSGVISGTATQGGSFTFTVRTTDSSGGNGPYNGSASYTLTVVPPAIVASPVNPPPATVGASYTLPITFLGGTAPYSNFQITAGSLPAGLTISSSAVISGTPTAGGIFVFTIQARDSSTGTGPYTGGSSIALVVNPPNFTFNPSTLSDATIGSPYQVTLTASGGTAPYSNYQIASGILPAGMTLSTSGVLSGTPTAGGPFSFTVQARDSSGGGGPYTGSASYTLNVDAPTLTLTPATLTSATVGAAYSKTLNGVGGTAPYGSFSISTGALPPGLSLNSAGVLSGTPTGGGTFNFTVQFFDSSTGAGPYQGNVAYSLVVNTPNIVLSPATLTNGQVGAGYNQTLTASGGIAPYSNFVVTSGNLPAGLSLTTGGVLSGTPTAGGLFTFTVQVTDSSAGAGPYNGSTSYTLIVTPPSFTFTPATLPSASVGANYAQVLSVSGGTATYGNFTVINGSLPAGLTLVPSTGTLAGIPTAGGTFNFVVQATDSSTGTGPYSNAQAYSLVVTPPTIHVTPSNLASAQVGASYSQVFNASGGTPGVGGAYTFQVASGALPAGLTLSTSGVLTGTPTAGGVFNFTVRATDTSGGAGPYSGTTTYSLTVNGPAITVGPSSLPDAAVAGSYTQTLTAAGGTAPYGHFAISSGSLPAGLALSPSGVLSGTPTAGGTFNFTVQAQDSSTGIGPYTGSGSFTLNVDAPTIAVTPSSLPNGAVQASYSATLGGTGGTAPYSNFTIISGGLPNGLSMTPAGVISGTPIDAGTFSFTVQTQDSTTGTGPYTGTTPYSLTINPPTIAIGPSALPQAAVASAYSQTLTASGGTAPYHAFIITSGRLPTGLTLTPSGVISGTPTAGGTFTFNVQTQDSSGGTGPYSGTRTYQLVVNAPSIALTPSTLPGAQVGAGYSAVISAAGGIAPYGNFTLISGSLPAGLTLSSSGLISGVPTQTATAAQNNVFTFAVQARDSSTGTGPFTGASTFTLTVSPPNVAISPTNLAGAAVGSSYSQPLSAVGGTAPYTFALNGGVLPAGLTLSSSGTISGTPTAGGSYPIIIAATDSTTGGGPYTQSTNYVLNVSSPTITVGPPTLPDAGVASTYSETLTSSGGTAPYGNYTVTSGSLPPGLSLSKSGVLSGTPTAGGTFNFTIGASDSSTGTGAPYHGSQTYSLTIDAPTITVTPSGLPNGQLYIGYFQTLSGNGGTAPYSFALTSGSVPAGLHLTAAGVLSGAPTVSGTFNFTVQATDSSTGAGPYKASQAYTLVVTIPSVTISPTSLPDSPVGIAYSQTLVATGANAPYRFSVVSGKLPAGLTISSGGVLSGTPSAGGTFSFTVKATDSSPVPFTATQAYTLTIDTPTFTFGTLPDATVAATYNQHVPVTGGTAPYKLFALAGGALPAGLTLTSSGVISGTPTAGGSFTFSVRLSDSSTGSGPYKPSQTFTLDVGAPNIVITPTTLPMSQLGVSYGQTIKATGGTGTEHYSIVGGSLPTGMTLNATTGRLSGIPTTSGEFDFVVQATDSSTGDGPYSTTQSLQLIVQQATTITFLNTIPDAPGSALAPFQVQVLDQFGNAFNGYVSLQVVLVNSTLKPRFATGSITRVLTVNGVATFNKVGINLSSLHLSGPHQYQLIAVIGGASGVSNAFSAGIGNRLI